MADDLKNLPPEERIKRLKELEKQKRKEIEEAEKAIKESESELTERRKWADKVPIPQVAKEDFKDLSPDEKTLLETHKGKKLQKKDEDEDEDKGKDGSEGKDKKDLASVLTKKTPREFLSLEELAQESVNLPPEIMNSQYAVQLSKRPMESLYNEMSGLKKAVEDKGYINSEESRKIEYLASAVEKKIEAGETGKYSFTEEVAKAANLTRAIGSNLRDLYKASKSSGNTNYQS